MGWTTDSVNSTSKSGQAHPSSFCKPGFITDPSLQNQKGKIFSFLILKCNWDDLLLQPNKKEVDHPSF
jgi:hypothetical protein